MSKQQPTVVLEKDKYTPSTEDYYFHNIPCPHCRGERGHYKQIGRDEYVWVDCGKCEGAGKFLSHVHVEWIPDYN